MPGYLRATYVTLEIYSTPARLTLDQFDSLVEAIYDRRDILGSTIGMNATQLDIITCVDAPTVAAGVVVATAAFELALIRAGLFGIRVDEVRAYVGTARDPRSLASSK